MSYPQPGQSGAFQAHNGRYVCADQGRGWALIADRQQVGEWETFHVEQGPQGRLAFRSKGSGHFICADVGENGQTVPVHARDRNQAGDWETFTVEPFGDGSFGIRAHANNRLLCPDSNIDQNASPVHANRDQRGPWESFRWIPQGGAPQQQWGGQPQQQQWGQPQQQQQWGGQPQQQQQQWGGQPQQQQWNQAPPSTTGQQWGQPPQQQQQWGQQSQSYGPGCPQIGQLGALQCAGTGKYVCADKGRNWELICNRTQVGDWEKFTAVQAPQGRIAFRSHATNKFVVTDVGSDNRGPIHANDRQNAGDWESFTIQPNGDGTFSLRSHANNRIVCADGNIDGDHPLFANRDNVGDWEKFRWHPA